MHEFTSCRTEFVSIWHDFTSSNSFWQRSHCHTVCQVRYRVSEESLVKSFWRLYYSFHSTSRLYYNLCTNSSTSSTIRSSDQLHLSIPRIWLEFNVWSRRLERPDDCSMLILILFAYGYECAWGLLNPFCPAIEISKMSHVYKFWHFFWKTSGTFSRLFKNSRSTKLISRHSVARYELVDLLFFNS